jgi:hypothetical protein
MVVASARRVVGEQAQSEASPGRAMHLTPATAQGSGPPAASTPRTLTVRGGFIVLDSQQCRLHDQAHAQGYTDLASYLQARCQQKVGSAWLKGQMDQLAIP